jgi:hypothetical protein
MSKKQEATSNVEQGLRVGPSVYDFLYQDVRRVGSLLAQFEPSGHLQSIKHLDGYSETAESNKTLKPTLNLAALKIEGSADDKFSDSNTHSAERAYDPLWVNAISLLTYLQNADLLKRNLNDARLGQIVLASGGLQVFDMATLQRLWSEPKILQEVLAQIGEKDSASRQQIQKKTGILKLLSIMPHPVQAVLNTGDHKIWAVLNDSSLETSAASIFLKYGTHVEGEWNMLGVLDAFPDSQDTASGREDDPEANNLIDLMAKLKDLARRLGRPAAAYGMTPLLIFRQIVTSVS